MTNSDTNHFDQIMFSKRTNFAFGIDRWPDQGHQEEKTEGQKSQDNIVPNPGRKDSKLLKLSDGALEKFLA